MTTRKFGWRKANDDADDGNELLYKCTECGREKIQSKPGLNGGKLVARCGKCKETVVWEYAGDDEGRGDE